MKKFSAMPVLTGTLLAGVAIACNMEAMPALIVDVSAGDIEAAAAQGFSNPIRAAGLINLDQAATALLGASTWHSNNYVGPVTYLSPTILGMRGRTIVTEDKPCDSDAIDKESDHRIDGSYGDGGGDGGTGGSSSGGGYIGPGGCVLGCETGTVTVGGIQPT